MSSQNASRQLTPFERHLGAHFAFSPHDLEMNRQGKLSTSQQSGQDADSGWRASIGLGLVVGLATGIVGLQSADFGVSVVNGLIFGVGGFVLMTLLSQGILASFRRSKIQAVTGPAQIKTRSGKQFLWIGTIFKKQFDARGLPAEALPEGVSLTVYFKKAFPQPQLLSIELVD